MSTGLFGFVAMLCLLGLGVPVAYAVGTVAIAGIFYAVGSTFLLSTIQSLPYAFASDYNFVVVPLFVLMGTLAMMAYMMRGTDGASNTPSELALVIRPMLFDSG